MNYHQNLFKYPKKSILIINILNIYFSILITILIFKIHYSNLSEKTSVISLIMKLFLLKLNTL